MTENCIYRNDFVLYFHRNISTEDIFYVGVGQKRRANEMQGRNFLWKRYVQKYGKPKVEIYKTNLSMVEATYLEAYFIKKIGRRIDDTGNLTNLSKGGEGVLPFKRPEAQVKKLVEWMKINFVAPKGENHWAFGRKLSEEHKLALITSQKGKKQSAEHIEKRTAPRRGVRPRQESIDKMAASLKGKKLPEDVKLKIGIKSKERWQDTDFREKAIAYRKGKIRNKRQVIDNNTGIIYESAKEAALAVGIKQSYFSGMMAGIWTNKSNCAYLEPRPFKNGKQKRYIESILN